MCNSLTKMFVEGERDNFQWTTTKLEAYITVLPTLLQLKFTTPLFLAGHSRNKLIVPIHPL